MKRSELKDQIREFLNNRGQSVGDVNAVRSRVMANLTKGLNKFKDMSDEEATEFIRGLEAAESVWNDPQGLDMKLDIDGDKTIEKPTSAMRLNLKKGAQPTKVNEGGEDEVADAISQAIDDTPKTKMTRTEIKDMLRAEILKELDMGLEEAKKDEKEENEEEVDMDDLDMDLEDDGGDTDGGGEDVLANIQVKLDPLEKIGAALDDLASAAKDEGELELAKQLLNSKTFADRLANEKKKGA